ncbi:MAG: type II secretion system secretin GspD [Sulfuricaulis sp.]
MSIAKRIPHKLRQHVLASLFGTIIGIFLAAPLVQAQDARLNPYMPQPPGSRPAAPAGNAAPVPQPMAPPPAMTPMPATPAAALSGPTLRPGEMMFNFQDADIQAVVKTVSQITGKNFLIDPRVRGKLTIISTQPVSRKAIYQIFLASLKAQGFTAVGTASGFIKLVPLGDAKQGAEVITATPRPGEQTVTHVVTIQHGSAAQMVPLLRPLMAPTSQISVYPPANTLIITDYADNIRSLLRIIETLDQQGGSELAIIPLKYASALDIADVIVRLYPNVSQNAVGVSPVAGTVGEADRVTIMPDLRTNSLLVRAGNPGTVNDLRALVAKLDVPAKVGGNTRVVYLRNADATKLAEILRGLMTGEARTQAVAAIPGRPVAAQSTTTASTIQADEATNSLIISAPDAVFNNLRAVIEKLDVRRAQVYVEALIVEITTDKASQFGFQWAGGGKAGSGAVGGITNFPAASATIPGVVKNPASLASAGGLTLAYVGKKIMLSDGTTVRSLGALASALESKSIANVLSMPNLLTLDNAEAKIVVGQNVPFVTGSFAQATTNTGVVNPFQTVERKDVGLTLKIKPQITEGGGVKLQIHEEASSVATAPTATQDLITNTRSLDTTVIVDDGSTIALGGLIEDNNQNTTQAVPFLGRIPLLGWLFKYQTKEKKKTNLMVFLRPIIVRAPEDSYGFTNNRYDEIRAVQKTYSGEVPEIIEQFKPAVPAPEKKDKSSDEVIPPDKVFGPPNVPDTTPGPGDNPP